MSDFVIVLLIIFAVFALLIKGVVKTFQRQPVVAILCVIFLLPIYFLWAFVEIFTGDINK